MKKPKSKLSPKLSPSQSKGQNMELALVGDSACCVSPLQRQSLGKLEGGRIKHWKRLARGEISGHNPSLDARVLSEKRGLEKSASEPKEGSQCKKDKRYTVREYFSPEILVEVVD
jgi:hypothetical protein